MWILSWWVVIALYSLDNAIRAIATKAVSAGRPVSVMFGTVTGVSPLSIVTEQKLMLDESFLILTEAVKDHEHEITVLDWRTEAVSGGSGDASYASHAHPIKGRKRIILHNALQVGEKVLLLAMEGGQRFVVVDRV